MTHLLLTRPRLALVGMLLGAASLLAACGDTATPTTAPVPPTATIAAAAPTTAPSGSGGAGAPIAVTLKEWAIDPATISVPAGHQVFKVTNAGKFPHNFSVMVNGQEQKTANLKAGETATLETDLTAATYPTLCDLPGHKDKGMAGTIVVK